MAINPQAHNFYSILQSIQSRLVTITGLDIGYVRLCASDDYRYDYDKTMVVIRPLSPQPFTDAGGGRQSRIEKRIIRVYCNVRSSLDAVGKDDVALQTIIALENSVNDALDEYTPQSSGTPLTIEPLHPIDGGNGPPIREANDDIGELFSMLTFECVFVRPNTIPIP